MALIRIETAMYVKCTRIVYVHGIALSCNLWFDIRNGTKKKTYTHWYIEDETCRKWAFFGYEPTCNNQAFPQRHHLREMAKQYIQTVAYARTLTWHERMARGLHLDDPQPTQEVA